MTEELEDRIQDHLSGFQARQKEIEEMKAEWHEFKNRALYIMVSGLIAFVGYGIWVGTIQTREASHDNRLQAQSDKIEAISLRQQNTDVTNAEIRAKLSNIEATLVEIKATLKLFK